MTEVLPFLVLAALLEIVGDATIRYGLVRRAWLWVPVGGALLVAYGLAVNVNRSVDFGRLMGVYIVVFFVVSQVVSWALFRERPSAALMIGGALIVAGGLVIHVGHTLHG